MADTLFRHGEPLMIDYTPSADVAAGEVVLLGNTTGLSCGIAHKDITNATLGAVAAGGGVYLAVNLNNAADYATVYWDDSANKLTTVSTNNALFGYVVRDGAGDANSNCLAMHAPWV
jgi:predicted RecA/RadA family phage recombinase